MRLDRYFRIHEVENDDWSPAFRDVYEEPYWREYVEPGYEGKWNGLMVRGIGDVERAATCVFPSDRIVGGWSRERCCSPSTRSTSPTSQGSCHSRGRASRR